MRAAWHLGLLLWILILTVLLGPALIIGGWEGPRRLADWSLHRLAPETVKQFEVTSLDGDGLNIDRIRLGATAAGTPAIDIDRARFDWTPGGWIAGRLGDLRIDGVRSAVVWQQSGAGALESDLADILRNVPFGRMLVFDGQLAIASPFGPLELAFDLSAERSFGLGTDLTAEGLFRLRGPASDVPGTLRLAVEDGQATLAVTGWAGRLEWDNSSLAILKWRLDGAGPVSDPLQMTGRLQATARGDVAGERGNFAVLVGADFEEFDIEVLATKPDGAKWGHLKLKTARPLVAPTLVDLELSLDEAGLNAIPGLSHAEGHLEIAGRLGVSDLRNWRSFSQLLETASWDGRADGRLRLPLANDHLLAMEAAGPLSTRLDRMQLTLAPEEGFRLAAQVRLPELPPSLHGWVPDPGPLGRVNLASMAGEVTVDLATVDTAEFPSMSGDIAVAAWLDGATGPLVFLEGKSLFAAVGDGDYQLSLPELTLRSLWPEGPRLSDLRLDLQGDFGPAGGGGTVAGSTRLLGTFIPGVEIAESRIAGGGVWTADGQQLVLRLTEGGRIELGGLTIEGESGAWRLASSDWSLARGARASSATFRESGSDFSLVVATPALEVTNFAEAAIRAEEIASVLRWSPAGNERGTLFLRVAAGGVAADLLPGLGLVAGPAELTLEERGDGWTTAFNADELVAVPELTGLAPLDVVVSLDGGGRLGEGLRSGNLELTDPEGRTALDAKLAEGDGGELQGTWQVEPIRIGQRGVPAETVRQLLDRLGIPHGGIGFWGRVGAEGRVEGTWSEPLLPGRVTVSGGGVAAGEARAEGISGRLVFDDLLSGALSGPQRFSVARLDAGAVLEDGRVVWRIEPSGRLRILGSTWNWAGGRVLIGPANVSGNGLTGKVPVRLDGVALDRLLALARIDGLSGTGRISGTVPLVFRNGGVTIEDASLAADGPGGALQYAPSAVPTAFSDAGNQVEFLLKALENFQYTAMEMSAEGDAGDSLGIRFALAGANPSLYDGYPIRLNVTISGDLDDLIKANLDVQRLPAQIRRRLSGGN